MCVFVSKRYHMCGESPFYLGALYKIYVYKVEIVFNRLVLLLVIQHTNTYIDKY